MSDNNLTMFTPGDEVRLVGIGFEGDFVTTYEAGHDESGENPHHICEACISSWRLDWEVIPA